MTETIRPRSQGGFEDIYPQVTEFILTHDHPEDIAFAAGLTPNQWTCLSHYLDAPDFKILTQDLPFPRTNLYVHIQGAYTKLQAYINQQNSNG